MAIAILLDPALSEEDRRRLRIGDRVCLTGQLLTARDAACKRLVADLRDGHSPPVDLSGRLIYAVGPTPPKPGQVIGSAGPTTANRLLPFLDDLLKAGIAGLIGKGDLPAEAAEQLRSAHAIYFAATGGAAALIARSIVSADEVAYSDLGAEAIRRLGVVDFPAVVAVDAEGRNLHETARSEWQSRLQNNR